MKRIYFRQKTKFLYLILLIFIVVIGFALRFYKLGQVPYGFAQDESAIGYIAYSLIQTGKDEHGVKLPVYFKAFGDYKLPVYIYSTVASVRLFGMNEFAVRFPSALFGTLTIPVFYLFIKELLNRYKNQNKIQNYIESIALFSTFLLAINPWHIHYNRITLEVSISLFLFVFGGFLLLRSFNTNKKGLFLFGTLFFILSLYSYNLTRLLSPLLYILFLFGFKKDLRKLNKTEVVVTGIISIILLVPFVLTFFQKEGVSSAKGTLIFSSAAVQAPLIEFRSYLVSLPQPFIKLFFNSYMLTFWHYIQNLISYFSVLFLFISGTTHGNHGIGNVGQMYIFEFITIIVGIYAVIKEKIKAGFFMFAWAAIVIAVASLTREVPQANRSFFLIAPLIFISGLGAFTIFNFVNKQKGILKKPAIIILVGFVVYNVIYYLTSYYVRFPIYYAKAWRSEDKEVALYIKENQNKYDNIIFDSEAGFVHTSLLFYSLYPPSQFQNEVVWEADDPEGFSMPISFGKYQFKKIDWRYDYPKHRTLYITTPNRKPDQILPFKTFYYPERPVVFSNQERIIQYPIREVAYELVESQ